MSVLKLCANHPICFNLQIDGKLGSLLEFFFVLFLSIRTDKCIINWYLTSAAFGTGFILVNIDNFISSGSSKSLFMRTHVKKVPVNGWHNSALIKGETERLKRMVAENYL